MSLSKNVGIIGVKPPEKECKDEKCPYHGHLKVRGMVLEGTVYRYRANKVATIVKEYLKYNPKYKRYERRTSKIHAYVPQCIEIKEGDRVIIGESRPLAKSVAFVVVGRVS
ncbi:30S ribosomal protein S17 [Sulfolobales archaeon HS-7]|nr:30S ribosomal protein S17 [Sulfolobales archaeon HS-7]